MNGITSLFSGLNSNSKNNNYISSIYNNISELSNIRKGSYYMLAKKYYGTPSVSKSKDDTSKTKYDPKEDASAISSGIKGTSSSLSTSSDSAKKLAMTESSAEDLKGAVDSLSTRGTKSVFNTDYKGNYNTDKIFSAVSDFVDKYNSLIKETKDVQTSKIKNYVSSLEAKTSTYQGMLGKVGIDVEEDGSLKIDEKAFRASDMTKVSKLFAGTQSYGRQVGTVASQIENAAKSETTKANTYTKAAAYSDTYNYGSMFDSMN